MKNQANANTIKCIAAHLLDFWISIIAAKF